MVRGTLRADALPAEGDSLHVRVGEGAEPVPVRDGSFEVAGVPPGPVVLRFGGGEEEVARMEVRGLPEGAELTLEEVRIHRESGLAFPGAIRLEGAEVVRINGIRRAPPGAVPEEVVAGGTVLAVSNAADALLFRPADEALPDLRVVLTPGTEVETIAGDSASPGELEAGDPARVEGGTVGGMVVARRIVVPASRAVAEERGKGRGNR